MGFFEQAWIGLQKELSVYKNNPKLLLMKGASVLISVTLTIATSSATGTPLQTAVITNAICQMILFFTPARAILFKVSSERADNFKDYLMINGMTKSAYQAKIAVSNYVEMFFFAVPQAIGTYISYHSFYSSWTVIFELMLVIFLGGVATTNMALYLSTLFSPKNAPPVGSMIILLFGLLYFLPVYAVSSLGIFIAVSLHPGAAIAFAVNSSLPADTDPTGNAATNIDWKGYTPLVAALALFIDIFIFLGLYLYKEREMDTDARAARKAQSGDNNISIPLLGGQKQVDLERQDKDVNSALHYERILGLSGLAVIYRLFFVKMVQKTIEALHMTKVFPGCTAVDNISFTIHEKEIFCLLGHNGAGKSTLVNILTGLIPKTEGIIRYNGEEVHNLDRIRGQVGFCPQKDFLLMENTVLQNLGFFAQIKNVPKEQMKEEIVRVMTKLGLTQFKDMPAKKLSGGFKRKLNVAIALLKDPNIIIMDEPTSGMDPVSRRNFWAIIKGLKNEKKTVILTTQFLDEAEELADRVAIMTKGKIFAVGTSEFLKKRFGTGYNLIVQKRFTIDNSSFERDQASEVTSKVQSVIQTASLRSDTAPNVLQFTLPFNEQGQFSTLFSWLETIQDIQVGLQMVSLEEAFVSLGLDLDKVHSDSKHGEDGLNTNVPDGFFQDRTPTFGDQFKAVVIARLYKMRRNMRGIFFSCFPLLFIVGGVAIGGNLSDSQGGLAMIITMMLTGNAFLISSFTIPVATERVLKITHSLKGMGLRTLPYWLGNLAVDLAMKLIMMLIVVVSIYIFNVGFLKDVIGQFIGLYIAFSFNLIIVAYNLSLTFESLVAILIAGPALLIGGGTLPNTIAKVLEHFFGIHLEMYVYIISFIFFGPAILLQLGMNVLIPQYGDSTYLQYAPFSQCWPYIVLSFGMGIVYLLKLLYTDSKVFELKDRKVYNVTNEDEAATVIEEDDIAQEKARLRSSNNEDLIKAIEVQKVYPNGFKALYDLTFGVEKGQIFCLLGPNGAGKTTAFEILTTTIPKTDGQIQLEGKDLSRKLHEVFYNVGICPQSNTLWDTVSVVEHLRVYARIKGMKGPETEEVIQYLLKSLRLEEYADKEADKLSGGNKRKLCVAMSMVGAPKLLFLDEPSTGMDPVARSFLWTLIKDVMKGKKGAIVLTTHYMQEAELVGDKLGILVNGRFTTIGSLPELKKKFGEYSIVVHDTEGGFSETQIEAAVKSVLPEAKRQRGSGDKSVTFKVPSNSMRFARIFSELEEMKSAGKIRDFSIYTTTLEQIFIKLAKQQRRLTES